MSPLGARRAAWSAVLVMILLGDHAEGYKRKAPSGAGFQGGVNPDFKVDPETGMPPRQQPYDPGHLSEGFKPPEDMGFQVDMPGLGAQRLQPYVPEPEPVRKEAKNDKRAADPEEPKFGDPEAPLPEMPAQVGMDHYLLMISNLNAELAPKVVEISEKRSIAALDSFDKMTGAFQVFQTTEKAVQARNHDDKLMAASSFRSSFVAAAWKERQRSGATPLEVFLGFVSTTLERSDSRENLETLAMVRSHNGMLPTPWKLRIVRLYSDACRRQRKEMTAYRTEEEFGGYAAKAVAEFADEHLRTMHLMHSAQRDDRGKKKEPSRSSPGPAPGSKPQAGAGAPQGATRAGPAGQAGPGRGPGGPGGGPRGGPGGPGGWRAPGGYGRPGGPGGPGRPMGYGGARGPAAQAQGRPGAGPGMGAGGAPGQPPRGYGYRGRPYGGGPGRAGAPGGPRGGSPPYGAGSGAPGGQGPPPGKKLVKVKKEAAKTEL